jgi:hypothetical protein
VGFERAPNLLCAFRRGVQIDIWKQDGEFFSTVPCGNVRGANRVK